MLHFPPESEKKPGTSRVTLKAGLIRVPTRRPGIEEIAGDNLSRRCYIIF